MTTSNLLWGVIINVCFPGTSEKCNLRQMELGNQNSNPYSSIPQLYERGRNRAGKGKRGRGLVPYTKVSKGEEEALSGLSTRRASPEQGTPMNAVRTPGHGAESEAAPILQLQWSPQSLWHSGERVGFSRHPGWTSRIQRVSTHHGGAQWGAECSEFDMNWAQWHASTQSL